MRRCNGDGNACAYALLGRALKKRALYAAGRVEHRLQKGRRARRETIQMCRDPSAQGKAPVTLAHHAVMTLDAAIKSPIG